jgi:hypothetical protein
MSGPAALLKSPRKLWTAADLHRKFGPIPFERIRQDRFTRLTASMQLDGGDFLPGFSVQVGELFATPKRPGGDKRRKQDGPQPGKGNGRRSR